MQKSKQTMMVAPVAGLVAVAPLTAGAQDKTDKAVDKTKAVAQDTKTAVTDSWVTS
jgi:hypothetical protein